MDGSYEMVPIAALFCCYSWYARPLSYIVAIEVCLKVCQLYNTFLSIHVSNTQFQHKTVTSKRQSYEQGSSKSYAGKLDFEHPSHGFAKI